MHIRGNYIHTEIPSFRWSQVHALAVVPPCPGLVVEHNVIRHGQWVVRSLTGEFRYNLVLDADGHNFIIGPSGKCHIHHNIWMSSPELHARSLRDDRVRAEGKTHIVVDMHFPEGPMMKLCPSRQQPGCSGTRRSSCAPPIGRGG